jgi:hypothetical protein
LLIGNVDEDKVMKIVIHTQCLENYGNESNPRWKYKGGSVYVYEGLSTKTVLSLIESGNTFIEKIFPLIEYRESMFEEYVIEWEYASDDEVQWEDWRTPIILNDRVKIV